MKRLSPLAQLLAVVGMVSAMQVAYVVAQVEPSDGAVQVIALLLGLALLLWVVGDARRRQAVPCYDFGLLVMILFPASLLWYALWTRGWRGLFLLAGLLVLMLLPWLTALAVWIVLYLFV